MIFAAVGFYCFIAGVVFAIRMEENERAAGANLVAGLLWPVILVAGLLDSR